MDSVDFNSIEKNEDKKEREVEKSKLTVIAGKFSYQTTLYDWRLNSL